MIYHINIILYIDRFDQCTEDRIYSVFCTEYSTDIFVKDEIILQKLIPELDEINCKNLIYPIIKRTISLTEEEFFYINMKYPDCNMKYVTEENINDG